jgi:hypothetical protein
VPQLFLLRVEKEFSGVAAFAAPFGDLSPVTSDWPQLINNAGFKARVA